MEGLQQVATNALEAKAAVTGASVSAKNAALEAIARALEMRTGDILAANRKDMDAADESGMPQSLRDRLLLDAKRVAAIAGAVRELIALEDPVGATEWGTVRPNGLSITRVRVPLGVIGIIYEARPNVTVDAATLCLKAGNVVILRGGKEAFYSNLCLTQIMQDALVDVGLPRYAVQLIEDTTRESATAMMRMNGVLDVLIPRGGAGLIRAVVENATVPVIETGTGNCHVYVDASADLEMAATIIDNAKTSRPSVCNAAESLLVHASVAEAFLPLAKERLDAHRVALRGCSRTMSILGESAVSLATEEDYAAEFGDYILSVKVVDNLSEAVAHINRYGTKHSEAIITKDYASARRFQHEVDAAAVYVNASTRFTDGGEFGFGAEIGISTQKLHARGPMGLRELTTVKYLIDGDGQIR